MSKSTTNKGTYSTTEPLSNMADLIRRYFRFSHSEMRGLIITILICGFIFGFNDGQKEFELGFYLKNMIVSMLIAAVSILVYHSGTRIGCLMNGHRPEFQMWWYGLLAALAVTFVTRGYVPVLFGGGFFAHHLAAHRLGWFRYGMNLGGLQVIALMGPLFAFVFASIIMNLALYVSFIPISVEVARKIFNFNMLFILFNLFPIHPLDGSKIMFRSRFVYSIIFGVMVTYTILAYAFNIYSWILAFLGGIVVWVSYYLFYERGKD